MKIFSVTEFRDKATKALKSREPVLIMRRGEVAGIYFPTPLEAVPFEFRKDIFLSLTNAIKKDLARKGVKEDEVLEDFEQFRKTRRRR